MVDKAALALASVSASLVIPHDVSGTLVGMLGGIRTALEVGACGMLAVGLTGRLEVLTASSHSSEDLALFEAQTDVGPAITARLHNEPVTTTGLDGIRAEWPVLATAMEAAGYASVLACPLRWNGEPLGAAAVFRRGEVSFSAAEQATLQAFADLSMLVVVHTDPLSIRSATQRIDDALEGRVLIEQAKGVLAYQRRIGMAEAYEVLQELSRGAGVPLTAGAQSVIAEATRA